MGTVSRLQLDHPALGTAGGAPLHASVEGLWTSVGDNINGRFFTAVALADSGSVDFTHNFNVDFADLGFTLYEYDDGTGELISQLTSGFTTIAKVGSEKTAVTVTNSSGGPKTIAMVMNLGSGAGGGGGGSLNWDEPPGSAPVKGSENDQLIYMYESGLANSLVAFVKVPQGYIAGVQINMRIALYSPSTINTIRLETVSTLIREGLDGMGSTTNQHTSTNSALANSGVANKYRETVCDLTDASGEINSVGVSPGDLIKVELSRATDTDTADIRFIPNGTEVE